MLPVVRKPRPTKAFCLNVNSCKCLAVLLCPDIVRGHGVVVSSVPTHPLNLDFTRNSTLTLLKFRFFSAFFSLDLLKIWYSSNFVFKDLANTQMYRLSVATSITISVVLQVMGVLLVH